MSYSVKLERVNFVIICLIFLTSSFDIFLNLRFGGFSFRFSYILMGLLLFVNISRFLAIKINGLSYLAIWTFILFLFLPNTTLLSRNIGYLIWHLVHIIFIVIFSNVIRSKESLTRIFKWYILSFVVIAYLGLFQFLLGVLGVDFFVEQWWITGVLPRVNGFTYEPSYYATYLIIGWMICFVLLVSEHRPFSKKLTWYYLSLISLSIILSSSRMGIIFMLLVMFCYLAFVIGRSIIRLRIKVWQGFFIAVFILLISFLSFSILPLIIDKYEFLLAGTGVFGQSSHSSLGRFEKMSVLWNVFLDSPFLGHSLGGIPSVIGEFYGVRVSTVEQAKLYEGINVFLEILVASGAIGFLFFMLYFFNLCYSTNKLAIIWTRLNVKYTIILRTLLFSLILELALLSFNQNILRPYLWVHIAFLNSAYFVLKEDINEQRTKTFING